MDDASARKAALEIALNVSAEPEALLEALRKTDRLLDDLEDVPEDVRDFFWREMAQTDGIPDRQVGRLWEPNALAEQWRNRDAWLTRKAPEILECFRKLAEHLSRSREQTNSDDEEV